MLELTSYLNVVYLFAKAIQSNEQPYEVKKIRLFLSVACIKNWSSAQKGAEVLWKIKYNVILWTT